MGFVKIDRGNNFTLFWFWCLVIGIHWRSKKRVKDVRMSEHKNQTYTPRAILWLFRYCYCQRRKLTLRKHLCKNFETYSSLIYQTRSIFWFRELNLSYKDTKQLSTNFSVAWNFGWVALDASYRLPLSKSNLQLGYS